MTVAEMDPVRVTLRDGTAVLLRSARASDAEAAVVMLREMAEASPWIVTEPDEVSSPEEWAANTQRKAESPVGLTMLAVRLGAKGEELGLVGSLSLHPQWRRKLGNHVQLGMGMTTAWRGLRLGRAMLEAALDVAAGLPGLEVVQLGVIPANASAQRLYESVGFVVEGRQRGCFVLASGERHDHVLMAIFVKPGLAPAGYCTWRSRRADGG